jgi:outer membrane biosynthesis protein TonB
LPDLAKSDQLTPSEQMLRDLENELRKADSVDTPPPAPRQPATALEMRSPLDSQPDPTSADTPPSPETTGTSPSVAAGMTPETRTAETKGSISNIGEEDSVAAAATPVGRYMRQVTSAVEKKWHYFRTQEADAVEPGRLSLRFYVNKFGKVEDLKFTMKDANALMEDFTIEAILKAEIPPIPSDLLPVLDKERLEINYDIVIHP